MVDVQVRPVSPPRAARQPAPLGPRAALRFGWAQLTSMRTALVLLFALAVGAIPGSLVPQRDASPIGVSDFMDRHPVLGPVYERLGLFNVYTSPWFAAIYLLLFLSLVGCVIPRAAVYARALRAAPPRTPRHLSRLPAYAVARVADPAVLERAAETLRAQRYRVSSDGDSVAAERGYLREAGNLVFHLSLLVVLLGVALGGLFGFRGTSVVLVGQGFANTLTQYDDITAGGYFRDENLQPFTVGVREFRVRFETGAVQTGAARLFELDVEVTERAGAAPYTRRIQVNRPLTVAGTSVHLIGHGYAPRVTVRDGQGQVAFSGPVIFLPQDGNFTSAGVIKAPDARPERLAFQGFFLPTAVVGASGPRSIFPDALDPALFLTAYSGPPRTETGRPENVYSLDTTGLSQLKNARGSDLLRFQLRPGEFATLPGGKGSIAFDGWTRWVKLQISDTPGVELALGGVLAAVGGLCLSLFVRPRRIWVRVREGADGTRLTEVAGLDRADARAGLAEDVEELAAMLQAAERRPGR